MIAKLRGRVDSTSANAVVVDVGGVGYLLFCSGRTLAALPPAGEAVELLTITHVREDHIHLYGFLGEDERSWFALLTAVQGVGARVALGLLSVMTPEALHHAVLTQNRTPLTEAPNVGPKLAGRIVSELKDKAGQAALPAAAAPALSAPPAQGPSGDAVSALMNLGYRQAEALAAVQSAARSLGQQADLQALIRGGLRELAR